MDNFNRGNQISINSTVMTTTLNALENIGLEYQSMILRKRSAIKASLTRLNSTSKEKSNNYKLALYANH